MSLIASLFESRAQPPPDDDFWYTDTPELTHAGVKITPETALTISAVFAAVRLLAESLAQVPLILYRRLPNGGKERATDHPLYPILRSVPNSENTAFEYRELQQTNLGTRGNAIAQKVLDRSGRVRELIPLSPARTRIERQAGRLVYEFTRPNGTKRIFEREQIHHIRFMGDGLWGVSPVTLARQSMALSSALETHGSTFFGNGVRFSGVLEHPGRLGDKAKANLSQSIQDVHGGVSNHHKVFVLEEGMKWHEVSMSAEDAQFLQTRKFQVLEVARWYNVPPHMLKELERAIQSNVEQMSLEFVQYSLMPWFVRWEQAIERDLLTAEEREELFVEFLVDGLLRGDAKTRAEVFATMRQNGALSANEWRDKENLNPIGDQGDQYLIPLNMIPADMAAAQVGGDEPPGGPTAVQSGADDRAALPAPETRSPQGRLRLRGAHERIFHDAARRMLMRETTAVRRAAKRMLGKRDVVQFREWLEIFYRGFGTIAAERMLPAVMAYAEAVQAEAATEIGAPVGMTPQLEVFARAYADNLGLRHVIASRRQLAALLDEVAPEESEERVRQRLDEWDEKRPGKIASQEVVQEESAITREVFAVAGVTRLVWRTFGDNCPLCNSMNGRTASIRGAFVTAGDVVEGEGVSPLRVDRDFAHPPLHRGCNCGVVPG